MSIVGGYTLHLYCDCDACRDGNRNIEMFEAVGNNVTQCYKQARKTGWKLNTRSKQCFAPGHYEGENENNQ